MNSPNALTFLVRTLASNLGKVVARQEGEHALELVEKARRLARDFRKNAEPQKLDELHALEAKQYVDPVNFADIHSALGETDEALRWYEKAFEDRTPNMAYASIGPGVDPRLAGNPRYEAIVRKMNFPTPAR